ncbi:hypothetical protein L6452_00988 [Arctium lappa]|uniref:Uncharacterized protein n=1 Tax=Arctium lappa TaxID=4217 RepID=A0ACB9FF07_ARCLA|nr:hypothetical protein L6452_00988 [Arctium lappa]
MAYLKMNDSECIDEDTSGPKPMKERKETVDSIRGSPSWSKNIKDDCFQVGSSSRVTRSQRRKQLEEERKGKEQKLEDGGFGLLPLINIHHTRNFEEKSSKDKREESSGQQRDHEATEQDLLNKIMDKMASLKRLKQEAEGEIQHGMANFANKDKFISLQRELDSLFQSSSASGEKTPNTMKKTGLVNECTDIVLSQQVYESMRVSVENSKAMKFLRDIEPLGFDLGISPREDVQQEHASIAGASGSCGATDREKGKLFADEQASDEAVFNQGVTQSRISASVMNIVASDSCEQSLEEKNMKKFIAPKKEEPDSISDNPVITDNHRTVDNMTRARPVRRNVKLGDPLKSPYVVRILDFNVSAEDKRAHEWALSICGGKVDAVFRSNDCVNIFRTGLETLAATNMNVSLSVIAGWASIMNYEERFRNRYSIRRYFFSIEMMANPLLRMRVVDEKTQYGIFRRN